MSTCGLPILWGLEVKKDQVGQALFLVCGFVAQGLESRVEGLGLQFPAWKWHGAGGPRELTRRPHGSRDICYLDCEMLMPNRARTCQSAPKCQAP